MIGLTVLGRYEVERRIGSGGMGSVYVGKQKAVGRNVALKILRSDLTTNEHVRERFRREAEIIGKLRHPNTIQLIDYGETDDGMAVMVMELLVGRPLNDRLRESGPMPLVDALTVGIEVASSLAEAHLLGLVHRDLKPANIFLVEVAGQTHAKVLDFGIARILDEEATRLTSTGQVFGTPRYMSPEQALSTGEVDARSDIYSLGLIIYECIVGQPPFVAQTSIQYLSAHSTQTPPKLRDHYADAPEALEQLVDACLAKDPEDRPQTADAVVEALTAIRRSLEGGHTGPITIPRGQTRPGLVVGTGTGSGLTNTAVSPARTSGQTATALVGGAKTTVDDTLVRPKGQGDATSKPLPPPRSPYMLYGGVAAVVLALVIAGAAIWSRMREPIVESTALDASAVIAERALDAAVVVAAAPDAGVIAAAPDAA
ncbi:serine/threonine protein kinase, partial [Myxococcota bacterium]|nr:serine/threonine protein kinase [Myxococcota bacterium]